MRKQLLLICSVLLFGTYLVKAQTYVGSEACESCHSDKFNSWVESGHPYKFTVTNGEEPTYPLEAINFQSTWMDNLGDGTQTWADIAGVIGGYGWKARFVGQDGHIVGTAGSAYSTGLGHNQVNFFNGEDPSWSDYHTGDVKIYNYSCFKCHTTGGDTAGTWLEGVDGLGTFSEGGIGCEGCHGPGSDHIAGPTATNIDKVYEQAHIGNSIGGLLVGNDTILANPDGNDINFMCGSCHNRDYKDPINSSGGFIKHHEQWDEITASPHSALTCVTCHDPHKRVIWDGEGIIKECSTCHSTQTGLIHHDGENVTCIDCHMPYAAKSGRTRGESGYQGDIRSHLFKITVDDQSMFTEDGSWVKDDETREASLSLHYACLGCHNADPTDDIPDKTLAEAVVEAAGMHTPNAVAMISKIKVGIYPNPVVDNALINIYLPEANPVTMEVYSTTGKLVYSHENGYMNAGSQQLNWNVNSNSGSDLQPGIYYLKISAGNATSMKKLIIAN